MTGPTRGRCFGDFIRILPWPVLRKGLAEYGKKISGPLRCLSKNLSIFKSDPKSFNGVEREIKQRREEERRGEERSLERNDGFQRERRFFPLERKKPFWSKLVIYIYISDS